MRKKITLLFTALFLGFAIAGAQNYIPVSGNITDENNGDPVAGHAVKIVADSSYSQTVFTNEAGFYMDSVDVSDVVFLLISTLDNCSMTYVDTLIPNPSPNMPIIADFEICSDTTNIECQADFSYTIDSNSLYTASFFDNSTAGSDIASWSWNFGDGTGSTEQNPVKTFASPGTYEVCLTITAGECTSTTCMEVIVAGGSGSECQADFSYFADSMDNHIIYFQDQSTPPNQIISWEWVFGEGSVSNEQNPTFTFGDAGTYNVCLTIMTLDSCISTTCKDVVISDGGNTFTLGGNTFAGIYQLDAGYGYAYKMQEGNYIEVYSQEMDSLGYYIFELMEGNYITKVEPAPFSDFYDTYLPTYYGDVIHWEEAEQINLNQNIFTADIKLVELTQNAPGDGKISGYIMHEDNMRGDVPATNIQVMLANSEGKYVGMMYSNEDGYFEFANLANGSYTLYAEVMGKSIVPKDFILTDENQIIEDIVMTISETAVVFGIEDIASAYVENISEVYPNPVQDQLNVDVKLKEATEIQFNIINTTGQIVWSNKLHLQVSQTIKINTADLKQGIYFIEFTTEDQYSTTRRLLKY